MYFQLVGVLKNSKISVHPGSTKAPSVFAHRGSSFVKSRSALWCGPLVNAKASQPVNRKCQRVTSNSLRNRDAKLVVGSRQARNEPEDMLRGKDHLASAKQPFEDPAKCKCLDMLAC